MAWPDTPSTTYLPKKPPKVKSLDMNRLQQEINRLYGANYGRLGFQLNEDFNELFADATAGNAQVGRYFKVDPFNMSNGKFTQDFDATLGDGFFGAVNARQDGAGASVSAMYSRQIGVGARDFILSMRSDIVTRAQLNPNSNFGFVDQLSGDTYGFKGGTASTVWQAVHGLNVFDTTVTIVDGQAYDFQIFKVNGTANYLIDGVLVATFTGVSLGNAASLYWLISGQNIGAGTSFGHMHYYKLWVPRT